MRMRMTGLSMASEGDALRAHCRALVSLELEAIPPGAERALSPRERRLWDQMRPRRRRSFLGSRLALKALARQLDPVGCPEDPRHIGTLAADDIRPRCHEIGSPTSVAHDARWVIAVVGDRPIGVDVEPITDQAFGLMEMFLGQSERDLVGGCRETATRLWTIKEAAAKAMNVDLVTTWGRVQVRSSGPTTSEVLVDGRLEDAWHEVTDGHLFTLLQIHGRDLPNGRRRDHVIR
jgi:4'-phosphopantetheinyl transferase EntD